MTNGKTIASLKEGNTNYIPTLDSMKSGSAYYVNQIPLVESDKKESLTLATTMKCEKSSVAVPRVSDYAAGLQSHPFQCLACFFIFLPFLCLLC